MTTAATKAKRLDAAKRTRANLWERRDRLRRQMERCEAEINHIETVVNWLETMPVEDGLFDGPDGEPEP